MVLIALLVLLPLVGLSHASEQVCCVDSTCYEKDWPWEDLPLPDCPEDFNPGFYLHTRTNRNDPQTVSRTTVPSLFDKNRQTVLLVHGFQADHESSWVELLKDTFLDKEDVNLVKVGWGEASHDLNYLKVVSNARVVAREIELVVENLVTRGGATRQKVWCVGHSLGAQICGMAGKTEKLGRITGLDPAGPGFLGRDPGSGLEKTDASFVDVIHTNSRGIYAFGLNRPMGHMDFYPNEAKRQPGCSTYYETDINPAVFPYIDNEGEAGPYDIDVKCSHSRAYYYFIESIKDNCFLATHGACTGVKKLPGSCQECTPTCAAIGYAARGSGVDGNYYLKTSDTKPYCLS